MRPDDLYTKIFLDSGSADHTRQALEMIGFLDGQTTNPTYFVKSNPAVLERLERGEKFTKEELWGAYKTLAQEISGLVPADGSVSIEVYADAKSSAQDLISQAHELKDWIPNAHIKLPIIPAGLEAAEQLVKEGIRVNMTLCFAQSQAAAVHAATRGASSDQVFVSPFVSRLDKVGVDGFSLLQNVKKMFDEVESHVSILAASIHEVYDIAHVIEEKMDIITIPFDDVQPWVDAGMPGSTENLEPKDVSGLTPLTYELLDLSADWRSFDIAHELTDAGLQRFSNDWNEILER